MTNQTKRLCVPAMETIMDKTYPVLDHGIVRVVDYMGGDEAIVQMARVSYGNGTKSVNEDRGLIRYLIRHRHTSPLEGCELKLHLKMPIFVARQWVRHRTASMNEVSARYSEMKDEFFVPQPQDVHIQSSTNKQGSELGGIEIGAQESFAGYVKSFSRDSFELYLDALDKNISREMSRIVLPLNLYTEFYWKIDLHNLLHFCSLRSDPHAQKEIRVYSDIILHQIIKAWTPHVYEAALDYILGGAKLSRMELEIVSTFLAGVPDHEIEEHFLEMKISKRETDEFIKKIRAN